MQVRPVACGNERRATAEEGVIDRLPDGAVIEDRSAHAFGRLLRAVRRRFGILAAARYGPERRLLGVAVQWLLLRTAHQQGPCCR
jgi:hypothetical protein